VHFEKLLRLGQVRVEVVDLAVVEQLGLLGVGLLLQEGDPGALSEGTEV